MKYILKGDRQELEKVVGKAVEEVFKDYNVTYIGDCIKTVTPVGELYMNAKRYEEAFIECVEERIANYELRKKILNENLGRLISISENGLPQNACGLEFQKFIPIETDEIEERIIKFGEK